VTRVARGPLAVLLVCVVVVGIAAVLLGRTPPNDVDPSSRSAGNNGTQALYEWLSRLGLPVQRMSGDFTPSSADVLVVADPTVPFSPADASATTDMLRSGGELILSVDRTSVRAALLLLDAIGALPSASQATQTATQDARPTAPVDPSGLVHSVPMRPGLEFDTAPQSAPLLVVGSRIVGVAIPVGSGRAYVLGSPYPLSNEGLRAGDSALLALALIDRARGGHVAFDEFHHGENGGGGAAAALSGPVGLAGGLAALAVLVYLALSGRRLGRPIPGSDPARVPSATEYVDAMGALIERSAHRGGVADRYAQELKQRVGAAAAIDPRIDDEAFLATLEQFDPAHATAVREALLRCRELSRGRPSPPQLVALARQVDDAEAVFAVGARVGLAEFRR
jgi:hypothetical protein